MAKILKINSSTVLIGNDDGSIQEVRRSDLNFEPYVNDEVNVYRNETQTIVSKKDSPLNINEFGQWINNNLSNLTNQNQNQNTNVVYQSGSVVNKIAYLLITFFLGGIGIHKFYAGKVGLGIIYVLFCWTGIPAFVAFFEFIIACLKNSDSNGNIIV